MRRRSFIATALSTVPLLLSTKLLAEPTQAEASEVEVVNAGVGGNNTVDLLARIDKDCISHHSDLTVLMIGTNDMNSRKFIPLKEFEKNLDTIIQAILKAKSQIVLMNLLPVYEPYLMTRHKPEFYAPEGHHGRLEEMNALIKKKAQQFNLSFLDIHHLFEKAGNIGLEKSSLIKNEVNSGTTDGLHPTADGYRFLGLAVYDHIRCSNLSYKKIVCFGDSITFGDGSIDGESYPANLKKLLS